MSGPRAAPARLVGSDGPGSILRRPWWRYYNPDGPLPDFQQLVQSWDMAFNDSAGSDYVVGQLWGRFFADKYLLHQQRARLEFTDTLHAVRQLTGWVEQRFPNHRSHAKYVEAKANGPAVISALRSKIPGLIAVNPKGDKVARARAVAPELEAGNIHLPGAPSPDRQSYDRSRTPAWVQTLIEECAAFPNAAHDDQVDALSQALLKLAGTSDHARRPQRRDERRRPIMAGVRTMRF